MVGAALLILQRRCRGRGGRPAPAPTAGPRTEVAVRGGGGPFLFLQRGVWGGGARRPPARRAGQRTKFAAMAEPSGLRP